ncbi:MAG TPA: hypothetical protein VM657_14870 [Sphingomonas sp.]|nr:hypothetical protein [Sphingomonas sp.]
MRSLVLALITLAAPVSAQLHGGITSRPNEPELRRPIALDAGVDGDIHDIRQRIKDGRKSGQLSRHDAKALRRNAALIGEMNDRFARDGLSAVEQAELQTRVEVLRAQVDYRRLSDSEK